jgi:hypothetical protein
MEYNLGLNMDNVEINLDTKLVSMMDAKLDLFLGNGARNQRHLLGGENVPALSPLAKPNLDVGVEIVSHNPRAFLCLMTSEGTETKDQARCI